MRTPFFGGVPSRGGELVSDRGLVGSAARRSSRNPAHSPQPMLAGTGHIASGGVVSSMRSGLQDLCLQTAQQEVLKVQQKGVLPTQFFGQVVQSAASQSLLGSGVAGPRSSNQVVGPRAVDQNGLGNNQGLLLPEELDVWAQGNAGPVPVEEPKEQLIRALQERLKKASIFR